MSCGSSGAWKKWLDRRQWWRGQCEPLGCWRENSRWSGNGTRGRSSGEREGDDEWSWILVKQRLTKDKKAAPAVGSEKDPQAVTDTKAKRTFLEVVLGDDPVTRKKGGARSVGEAENQRLETMGEDDTINDFSGVVKHDLEVATKQSKAKSSTAGIEAKAAHNEREENGSVRWTVT